MKLQLRIFSPKDEKAMNEWLLQHEHQLIEKNGTNILPYGIVFAYDADRQRIEEKDLPPVTPTGPQSRPDLAELEKQRARAKVAGIVQELQRKKQETIQSKISNELALRSLKRQGFGKKGLPDPAKISEVEQIIHNNVVMIEEIDKLIAELEAGGLDEILGHDPHKPQLITA